MLDTGVLIQDVDDSVRVVHKTHTWHRIERKNLPPAGALVAHVRSRDRGVSFETVTSADVKYRKTRKDWAPFTWWILLEGPFHDTPYLFQERVSA